MKEKIRRKIRLKKIKWLWLFFILVGLTACDQTKIQLSESSTSSFMQSSKKKQSENDKTSQMIPQSEEEQESLSFIIDGKEFPVIAAQTSTWEALIEELPERFMMNDLNENEKYYEFSHPIPTNEQNVQKIEAGEVLLFGQKTLVLFYRSLTTSYRYTRIGSIKNVEDLKVALGSETIEVQVVKK